MNNIELTFAKETTDKLYDHPIISIFFNLPVDPERENVPDYFDVIKNPMDLGTVKDKLKSQQYNSVEEWKADIELIWNNAITYHGDKKNVVLEIAYYGKNKTDKLLALIPKSQEDVWFLKMQKVCKKINKIIASAAAPDTIAARLDHNKI